MIINYFKLIRSFSVKKLSKNGILYLRKIDKLNEYNDMIGCKLLAAFFVRLFQVVGALSLSIMDTK